MNVKVIPFDRGLSRAAAERRIREIAAETAALEFPWTTAKQMAAADITIRQVIDTLRHGDVIHDPAADADGAWRCTLRRRAAGRVVTLTAALTDRRGLAVIAVF